jgi:hypothetical protein
MTTPSKIIWEKAEKLVASFKKYDLEKRIKMIAINRLSSKLLDRNINNIWEKAEKLVTSFKKYDLEKRILKTAIEYINTQIQVAKEEQETQETQETQEKLVNEIENASVEAVSSELIASKIKDVSIQGVKERLLLAKEEKETKETQETYENVKTQIETSANRVVKNEIVINQIKEIATETVKDNIGFTSPDIDNTMDANFSDIITDKNTIVKQIISKLIEKHLPLIETFIAIEKKAIATVTSAVTPKDITELIKQTAIEKVDTLVLEEKLYNSFEKNQIYIKNINQEIEDLENNQSPNDEDNKNLSDKRSELIKKTAEQRKLLEQMAGIAAKESVLAKKISIYNSLVQKYKELLSGDTTNQYLTQIQNLNGIVNALKKSILEKELENIAIKTTLSSLPKPPPPLVAESKEPLIKNAAINAVKDATITELSKKIAAPVSTAPVSTAPAVNIENDLKNAALTALYRALLGVSKEHVDPSKKPTNFDVLITDKTYKYDDKRNRKEISELTKYDSILAK